MDIWRILGVEETKDEKALKAAYRRKLASTNPEDDPEGFKELRAAYEEAVKRAVSTEEMEVSQGEKDALELAIEEIYGDFSSRISVERWEELFDRDEFVSLESSEEAFKTLMKYLMENYCLPQTIWKLILDVFYIKERKKELAEEYPEDFISYIINNATYEDLINYYLFEGSTEDIDKYIDLYYKLDGAVRGRDIAKQEELIEEMKELDAYNPYLDLLEIKHKLQKMQEESREKLENDEATLVQLYKEEIAELQGDIELMLSDFPEDMMVAMTAGDVAVSNEDYERARECYEQAKKLAEDTYYADGKIAELELICGNYVKARDTYLELLKKNHYDNAVRAGMVRANMLMIEEFKKKLEENPEDNDTRMEMSWSYYQSYKFEEAIEVLNSFSPSEEKKCEYHNVKGRTYLCLMDYEKALNNFKIWKEEIELLADDSSEDAIAKKKRYEYVNFLIADCYIKTEKYKEARKYLDKALSKKHDEILLSYEAKCELEYLDENYEECINACDLLIEKDERNYIAYSFRAKAAYKQEYIKDAMIACEHAISVYPYVAEPYVLEARIYMQFEQIDTARQVLERYKVYEIDSDDIKFCEAQILLKEGKNSEAKKLLEELVAKEDYGESDLEDYSDAFMELYDLYKNEERYEDAIKLLDKVIKLWPKHRHAYGQKGMVLKAQGKYEEAIKLLSMQLSIAPNYYYYLNRGILFRFIGKTLEAIKDFKEALKYDRRNAFILSRLGLIYENNGKHFDLALNYYNQALEYMTDDDLKPEVFAYKARCLQCMNRFEESEECYKEYIQLFGLDPDVIYDYSELLLRMNKYEVAVDILKKCIDEIAYGPAVQMCIRQMIDIYGTEGFIDKANESFLFATSKDEADMKAYAVMAGVFRDHGLYDEAKKLYQVAISLDKDNKENYYSNLIETITAKKTIIKPNIEKYVDKAIIDPKKISNPLDYIKLTKVLKATKKYEDAKKIIDKGLEIKRCNGCFYGECHELWYQKALLFEHLKDYEMAQMCYEKAIAICGHNTLYEDGLKRLKKK